MLFSIQAFLENYLNQRGIDDNDGYSVKVANLYYYERKNCFTVDFIMKMHRLKTLIFTINRVSDRNKFEEKLLSRLDKKFLSNLDKENVNLIKEDEKGIIECERQQRLTIRTILDDFVSAMESRAIDSFWISRKKYKLRMRPEKIASTHLCVFLRGEFFRRSGIVLREFQSGIGYVDVGIIISSVLHLVEIKIIKKELLGVSQLLKYMRTEGRKEGFLLVFDARDPKYRTEFPKKYEIDDQIIYVCCVDINPVPPSQMSV